MLLTSSFDTILLTTLAQDGTQGPAAPGQETGTTVAADGSTNLDSSQAQDNPLGGFFTMMMVLLVGMIIFSMFGGRKQKKKRAAMLASLHKRDQVLTRGGVFGTIVEIKPDRVVLKVDESSNTRITVLRDSIEQVTADTPSN